MKTSNFDFELPENLIAQSPLNDRSSSRMMVLHKESGTIEHKIFSDIVDYFDDRTVLVRNNSRVIPARLFGTKKDTNAFVEILLLKQNEDVWQCLVGNARVVKVGTIITFGNDLLKAECLEVKEEGIRIFKMIYKGIFNEILETLGHMPLPPYIKEKLEDKERYQTVYSKINGSAAAPTAGLHFTNDIFNKLIDKGVTIVDITLHVGLGTFKPISTDDILDHKMHSESFYMDQKSADILNDALKNNKRIVSVGTTSTRCLESIYNKYGYFKECSGETNIFIYPGYNWKVVDEIITNFHLPKSTLIMMVSSFASLKLILDAYKVAIEKEYRFFSFGDCMYIKND